MNSYEVSQAFSAGFLMFFGVTLISDRFWELKENIRPCVGAGFYATGIYISWNLVVRPVFFQRSV